MKVRYTLRARRHLLAIATHIATDNPRAASKVVSAIGASIERLEHFPESGRPLEGGGWELILGRLPYIVAYRIGVEHVDILGVFHAARHPSIRAGT